MKRRNLGGSLPLCLAVATAAMAVSFPSVARAEIDVGGFVGAHFFNANNELGRFADGPGGLAPQHMVMLGLRLGWMPWEIAGLEGELGFIPSFVRSGDKAFEAIFTYRLQARVNVWNWDGRWRPFVVAGGGAMSMSTKQQMYLLSDTDPFLHLGVGLEYDIGRNWGVRVDGRMLFVPSVGPSYFTEEFELFAGLYGRFARAPKAPPPPVDRDGDTIPDPLDRCPDKAGPKENSGCPDSDSDGDGIVDRLDKCWETPGIAENQGCPDHDSDGDGLYDHGGDKCPTIAGPIDNGGCPDIDTDGDGIVDRLDKCPDQPETRNSYQDDDGCPDEIPVEIKRFTGVIRGINFRSDSAEILADSFPLLDEAAGVLGEFPEVKLEISGHTDTSGSTEHNVKLSGDRANAVRDYFIKKGIDPNRIRALGVGPSRPIEDNATPAGRAKNRRVEFRLIE